MLSSISNISITKKKVWQHKRIPTTVYKMHVLVTGSHTILEQFTVSKHTCFLSIKFISIPRLRFAKNKAYFKHISKPHFSILTVTIKGPPPQVIPTFPDISRQFSTFPDISRQFLTFPAQFFLRECREKCGTIST